MIFCILLSTLHFHHCPSIFSPLQKTFPLILCGLCLAAGVPMENILYLGGPNIASEIYNKEYANARICGADKWRKPLAKFLRQPHFIVWDNSDLVTHEVMGGLKNVYAIGAGEFSLSSFSKLFLNSISMQPISLLVAWPDPRR